MECYLTNVAARRAADALEWCASREGVDYIISMICRSGSPRCRHLQDVFVHIDGNLQGTRNSPGSRKTGWSHSSDNTIWDYLGEA